MPKDQISCKRPNRRQTNPGCVLLSNTDASSVAKQPHNMLLPACSNTEALLQVNADHQPVKYRCCRTSESAKGWHVQSKIQRSLGWPTPASADGPTALGSVSVHPLTHLGAAVVVVFLSRSKTPFAVYIVKDTYGFPTGTEGQLLDMILYRYTNVVY